MASKVYFTKEITPEKVVELYKKLGKELPGKVAVKLHSGEAGNQNFLTADFWAPMVNYVNGTVVECNTAYEGGRDGTDKHIDHMNRARWTNYFKVEGYIIIAVIYLVLTLLATLVAKIIQAKLENRKISLNPFKSNKPIVEVN